MVRLQRRWTAGAVMICALFFLCLQELSIGVAGSGVSANYMFILLPVIFGIIGIRRPLVRRQLVLEALVLYSIIYLIGIPGDVASMRESADDVLRRLISFAIFIFPLALALIEFTPRDLDRFKIAVILASVYYSLSSVVLLAHVAGSVGLFALKGVVGSQRYGFILCLGFFLALFGQQLVIRRFLFAQRVVICSIIFAGLVFTFSRASIVGVIGGLGFAAGSGASGVLGVFKRRRAAAKASTRARGLNPFYIALALASIVGAFGLLQHKYGVNGWEFYRERLLSGDLLETALHGDPNSSERFRYEILNRIVGYVATHPIAGSSFRGVYLVFEEFRGGGSAHSQYTDVFLRTGVIGGVLWLVLLYRATRACRHDRGLFAGMGAIIVYGLFHETFKESQGSFVFGMMLSFSYMRVLGADALLDPRRAARRGARRAPLSPSTGPLGP